MEELQLHQTPAQILAAATPEQRILWNYVFLRFGTNIGLSQVFYQGPAVNSEFLIYNARKIYLALEFSAFTVNMAIQASTAYCTMHDSLNVAYTHLHENQAAWDATAASFKYVNLNVHGKNLLFSRIVLTNIGNIKFIGYRLSI